MDGFNKFILNAAIAALGYANQDPNIEELQSLIGQATAVLPRNERSPAQINSNHTSSTNDASPREHDSTSQSPSVRLSQPADKSISRSDSSLSLKSPHSPQSEANSYSFLQGVSSSLSSSKYTENESVQMRSNLKQNESNESNQSDNDSDLNDGGKDSDIDRSNDTQFPNGNTTLTMDGTQHEIVWATFCYGSNCQLGGDDGRDL